MNTADHRTPLSYPVRRSLCVRVGISLGLCIALRLAGVPATAADAPATLMAGAAKSSLVPPFPTPMGGFGDRLDTFKGVDSPVYARALVCDNGSVKLAVVSVDLVGISRAIVDKARDRVEKETSIPGTNVLVFASHTHSAPAAMKPSANFSQENVNKLDDFFVTTIASAVAEAYKAMTPARLSFGSGRLDGITRNRQQNNDSVIDPEVGVLKVQKADSRDVIAVLFNFTGHPVVLGSENLKLSGEYPGHAEEMVESLLGGVALFAQGACGDITVKRSGPPFEEVKRLGHILGAEVVKTAEMAPLVAENTLASEFRDVALEPRKIPSVKDAQTSVKKAQAALEAAKSTGKPEGAIRRLERDLDSAKTLVAVAEGANKDSSALGKAAQACVHVMQIGPVVLVGIPGELFVEYGLEMKQRVRQDKGRPMLLVGYADGYNGYFVTPRAAHTGGYEQAVARVAPTAGRILTESAMQLVDECVTRPPK